MLVCIYGGVICLFRFVCIGIVVVVLSKHCCIVDIIFDDQCMVMAGDEVYVEHAWYGRYWMI